MHILYIEDEVKMLQDVKIAARINAKRIDLECMHVPHVVAYAHTYSKVYE